MKHLSMSKTKFINQWLRHFAKDLTAENLEKYVKEQYIWHVFSYRLINTEGLLVGDEARQAFNKVIKTDCICCDMFNNGGVTDKLSPEFDTAEKIDKKLIEFYVVSRDYSWTYIKTHEWDSCGPYFFVK